jgi:hypothetical protein
MSDRVSARPYRDGSYMARTVGTPSVFQISILVPYTLSLFVPLECRRVGDNKAAAAFLQPPIA